MSKVHTLKVYLNDGGKPEIIVSFQPCVMLIHARVTVDMEPELEPHPHDSPPSTTTPSVETSGQLLNVKPYFKRVTADKWSKWKEDMNVKSDLVTKKEAAAARICNIKKYEKVLSKTWDKLGGK